MAIPVWTGGLGRTNQKLIQRLNFYLREKRKKQFYSELHALQSAEERFSIFIYFLKNIKKIYQKTYQNF